MWAGALQDLGYAVRVIASGQELVLVGPDGSLASWRLRHVRRTPRPSEIGVDAHAGEVLWSPAMTPGLRGRLRAAHISWVSDRGEVSIHAPWGHIVAGRPVATPEADEVPKPAYPEAALLVLQHLLEHPVPSTQVRLAHAVGVSQPRVAQVLKDLRRDGLVTRVAGGWIVPRADRGFDAWMSGRRPPLMTTSWYSLAQPGDQVRSIEAQARAEDVPIRLCGDWAADVLAPWRRPGLVVVHAEASLDLDEVGFVSADRSTATAIVHIGPVRPMWTLDQRVALAMSGQELAGTLAPVTEIAREVLVSGGSDAADAVAELIRVWLAARATAEANA